MVRTQIKFPIPFTLRFQYGSHLVTSQGPRHFVWEGESIVGPQGLDRLLKEDPEGKREGSVLLHGQRRTTVVSSSCRPVKEEQVVRQRWRQTPRLTQNGPKSRVRAVNHRELFLSDPVTLSRNRNYKERQDRTIRCFLRRVPTRFLGSFTSRVFEYDLERLKSFLGGDRFSL